MAKAATWASVTKIAPDPRGGQGPTEKFEVLTAWVQRSDVGKAEPLHHEVHRLRGRCGLLSYTSMGQHANEPRDHDPRDPDQLRSVHEAFPPKASRVVERRCVVVGVDQQVHVRDYHPALFLRNSSTSS